MLSQKKFREPHQFGHEIGLMCEFEKLKFNFIEAYHEAINTILRKLLYTVNEKIHDEKDSQILYMKILELLNKLSAQFSDLDVNQLNRIMDDKLRTVKSSEKNERLGIDVKLADDVIETIENFKKEFLTEAHEKSS